MADDDVLWRSAEGKDFISKLRVKWAMKPGMRAEDQQTQSDKEMWKQMEELKQEIAKNMKGDKHEEEGIAETLCSTYGTGNEPVSEEDKARCGLLARLMFYMEGLNSKGTEVDTDVIDNDTRQLQEGMKCIIGGVYIQKIMDLACWGNDIREHALKAVDGYMTMMPQRRRRSRQCVNWTFGDTCVGGFPLESKITQWMLDDSSVTHSVQDAARDLSCEVQDWTQRKQAMEQRARQGIHATACAGRPGQAQFTGTPAQGSSTTPPAPKAPAVRPAASATPAPATPVNGKQATAAKPVAAKPVPKKPPELQDCQGDRLLEWRHPEKYVAHQYTADAWNRVKKVLDDFKKYMDKGRELMNDYGANCYNVGWDDLKEDGNYFKGQTVADVVRCRLMSTALFFANQQGTEQGPDKDMNQRLRCEIANTFGHMLKKMYCSQQGTWARGIEYAGITFKSMQSPGKDGHGGVTGPVVEGKCTMCGYKGYEHTVQAVDLDIAHWLRGQGKILHGIQHIDGSVPCDTKWEDYTKGKTKPSNPDKVDETKITEIKDTEKKIVDEAKRVIEKAKVAVEQEIEKQKAGKAPEPTPESTKPQAEPVPPASEENATEKGNDSTSAKTAKADNGAAPAPGDVGRSETSAGDDTVSPSPPAAGQGGTDPGGTETSITQTPSQPGPPGAEAAPSGTDRENSDSSCSNGGGAGERIVISCGSAQGPGLDPPADLAGLISGSLEDNSTSEGAGGGQQLPQEVNHGTGTTQITTRNGQEDSPPAPSSIPTTTGNDGNAGTQGVPGPSGQEGGRGEPSTPVEDGGSDDPPPLNPPKPKPNPNPNQSGSSGSGGTGGKNGEPSSGGTEQSAAGGSAQPDGGGGGGSASSSSSASEPASPGSTGEHTPGSSGPGSTGTSQPGTTGTGSSGGPQGARSPPSGAQTPETKDQPLPTLPPSKPFDPKDVKPYTPAIIPAVVGIGLIAFFLWKYFAYRATRRRTYRTIRDVPSPPLDEDILQHLQRGELPPPDYGYTMIRDRQPGRLPADRRRRQPRVNRRTIIELHLEVLNECDAAEWESVKEHYWKIVVEQFAQDLLREEDRNNHILGVSTTNQDLSGTHVSSTDSAGIDPCPPNEDNTWSCMETMQLATGPCPPHDPDLWSCMETIHLATVPCPPNEDDPDPWSCMQNIQFHTDASASNEERPDPWSCMETIQLATDPCAPTAHDPDPWSCMETIQLQTHPCAPHEDDPDPWRCMETMQLATGLCPPHDSDPWRCMQNIQFHTDASASNEEDRCNCMENIALDAEQNAHSNHRHATSYCTQWINWIDRNKHLLQACTTQPWFLQLKSEWTQYLRDHMAANEDNGHSVLGDAATLQMKTLRLWKEWVAKQHALMHIYGEEEWFKHLLNNVEEEIVPEKGEVPRVENDLDVDRVMGTADMLRVRDVPRKQLHPQPYMQKPLTALKLCMLLLASVIEECEIESSMLDRELYVDDLLHKLCN
ncbi:hypothetical protein AK88_05517 [Plasmodium fragile]|uniref:Schizont-infected cell agglutination C-terminal domain-containing protein n=1 Tax=Plasmodium fragile TaxID=5857 RepID=A0A0D9QCW7_PLAFR|nr:uncharacterized protein AK88_05517 [Plasmodium fragile]KJP84853.1 hypothetical protein AK88_05517 [Plasmodium fragile]